ncbi:MAG TPA: hypothetical protein VFD19_04895 [Clostridia bacterium]|nr:hypothetical protein [Clostridia bacterium]
MIGVIAEKAVDFTSPEVLAGYLATAIIAVTGLLLTVFILKKVLFKPLGKIIGDRQREIDETVNRQDEQAGKLREREDVLVEQERRQKEALEERRVLEEMKIKEKEEKIMADAKASAKELLAQAGRQIEQERCHEEERIYKQAVELAVTTMISLREGEEMAADETEALQRSIRDGAASLEENSLEA